MSPRHRKRVWTPAHSEAGIKILERCRDDLLKLNPDAPFGSPEYKAICEVMKGYSWSLGGIRLQNLYPTSAAEMIDTLGQAFDAGWRVDAKCNAPRRDGLKSIRGCIWSAELDMQTLTATRGRGFPLARVAERLRCPRCGCLDVWVSFTVPGAPGAAVMGTSKFIGR